MAPYSDFWGEIEALIADTAFEGVTLWFATAMARAKLSLGSIECASR
jgi:hypothetical protein